MTPTPTTPTAEELAAELAADIDGDGFSPPPGGGHPTARTATPVPPSGHPRPGVPHAGAGATREEEQGMPGDPLPRSETCPRGHPRAEHTAARAYGTSCGRCELDRALRQRARIRDGHTPVPRGLRQDSREVAEIAARHTRAGWDAERIAREMGCSARQVQRYRAVARSLGLLPPHPRSPAGAVAA